MKIVIILLVLQVVEGIFFIDSFNLTRYPVLTNVTFNMTTGYLNVEHFFYVLDVWNDLTYDAESCKSSSIHVT